MPNSPGGGRMNVFASKIVNCVASIKALEKPQYLYSPELTLPIDEDGNARRKHDVVSNTHYRSECRARPCGKDGCKRRITSYCIKIAHRQTGPTGRSRRSTYS
ncbi:hypothetical protein EVAR_30886_1 [Eumeta japonica]|uniref:Uncharacterized protein n=1 Tax=Eumeta variegata TaxID=151549 RepID=A0A4C1V3B4_EUMVA|nr:hypothetical protein EVAR_30886_1 [Eumeta japonica]